MALVACTECHEQVSDQAFKCPKCAAQLRKPKRTVFGKIVLWTFILFNILMAVWTFGGLSNNVSEMSNLSGAEQAGAAIGTGIGVALLLGIWVAGDVILGLFTLFTRPRSS